MTEILPDAPQSRRLVVLLAVFWGAWGIGILGFWCAPVLGAIAFLIAGVGILGFYLTLYGMWEGESGVPAWRMMFVPGFSKRRRSAGKHIYDLLRPSWIAHTLRTTGWPPLPVGLGLGLLLIGDLGLFVALMSQPPSS